eukprot:Gb_41413 [translate_table: standard]
MGFWHLWSMAALMSCLSNLNGFLALREVGGWRGLAWRRGIGDFITCTFQFLEERRREERSIGVPFSVHISGGAISLWSFWCVAAGGAFLEWTCSSWRATVINSGWFLFLGLCISFSFVFDQ